MTALLLSALLLTANPAPDVPALIVDAALRHGVSAPWMLSIARCESQYGAHWRTNHWSNPHRGVMQFSRITWQEQAPRYGLPAHFDAAYVPAWNIELAAILIARGEAWQRWPTCSRWWW